MSDTFGIPLAFVIFSAMALWIIIGSKGHWLLKMAFITIAYYFSLCLWNSLGDLQGWPTHKDLPDKFEVKWIGVKEPNRKTKDKGAIYVWIRDINPEKTVSESYYLKFHYKELEEEPRLHKLPYSRMLHEQAMQIQNLIKQGESFFGQMKKGGIEGEGKGEGKGKGNKDNGREGKGGKKGEGGDLSQRQDPIFHRLPSPILPEKITGEQN